MDKTITTAFMIVISIVLAMMLFNVAYPAIMDGGDALSNMAERTNERLKSQVEIIHAAGELDAGGWWQDVNGNGDFEVFIWVKNVGSSRIVAVDHLDLFFGPEGNFTRIPHESIAEGQRPFWTWQVENSGEWVPTATLEITVHNAFPLSSGRYFVKVTTPNGITDEYFMGL